MILFCAGKFGLQKNDFVMRDENWFVKNDFFCAERIRFAKKMILFCAERIRFAKKNDSAEKKSDRKK
jgi:hypothetical protein